MTDPSRTTTALLDGLRDPEDAEAWEAFDRRYRPIVIGFAYRLGLSDADAADVAQETILQFVKEYSEGRYARERGRLRTWLIALLKSKFAAFCRGRARRREERGDSAIVELPDDGELTEMWEAERRRHLLRESLDQLHRQSRFGDKSLQAFELFVVRETPPASVAEQLDITVHDVYLAKSRVAKKLRSILASLEASFDDAPPSQTAESSI